MNRQLYKVTAQHKICLAAPKNINVKVVETAKKYGVTNAPTLVAITADGFKKYTGVAGIKQFIDENK